MADIKIKEYRKVSDILSTLAPRMLEDGGSVKMRIMTQWTNMVGAEWARKAMPADVTFTRGEKPLGTLHLEVTGGYATEVAMMEKFLLEKIAVYFGYSAIHRIKIQQAPKG